MILRSCGNRQAARAAALSVGAKRSTSMPLGITDTSLPPVNGLCRTISAIQLLRATNEIFTSFQACRRSEEHTSELQSLMRISYAVFCLKKKKLEKSDEK